MSRLCCASEAGMLGCGDGTGVREVCCHRLDGVEPRASARLAWDDVCGRSLCTIVSS